MRSASVEQIQLFDCTTQPLSDILKSVFWIVPGYHWPCATRKALEDSEWCIVPGCGLKDDRNDPGITQAGALHGLLHFDADAIIGRHEGRANEQENDGGSLQV